MGSLPFIQCTGLIAMVGFKVASAYDEDKDPCQHPTVGTAWCRLQQGRLPAAHQLHRTGG